MKKRAENIRLIVCDVDNTIIPSREPAMSRRLARDFRKAMDKGIKVIINTGRHHTFLQDSLFEDLPMDINGTINGACTTDRSGNAIAQHPMTGREIHGRDAPRRVLLCFVFAAVAPGRAR